MVLFKESFALFLSLLYWSGNKIRHLKSLSPESCFICTPLFLLYSFFYLFFYFLLFVLSSSFFFFSSLFLFLLLFSLLSFFLLLLHLSSFYFPTWPLFSFFDFLNYHLENSQIGLWKIKFRVQFYFYIYQTETIKFHQLNSISIFNSKAGEFFTSFFILSLREIWHTFYHQIKWISNYFSLNWALKGDSLW
jgi:hypothetical protein